VAALYLNALACPISCLYAAGVRLRWKLYSSRLIRTNRLFKPVISIGNLSMGGTGKTPTVITIGRLLEQAGCRVSVLSRGYKGKHSGSPLMVSDGSHIVADAESAGDEPLVIARNLPASKVTVCKDRFAAGRMVESMDAVDVHLLDDGFQCLSLYRSFNLLLIDVTNPWAGGLPPLGRRREPFQALSRADAILLTRCQKGEDYGDILGLIRKYHSRVQVFRSQQRLEEFREYPGEIAKPMEQIAGRKVLALSGIGNPAQFQNSLIQAGGNVAGIMAFPDHHRFTRKEYRKILQSCRASSIDVIVTTEKDLERLDISELSPWRVWAPKLEFILEEPDQFMDMLIRAISTTE
jgi:tetraacyldisaccharide 4'-kinase